MAEEKIISIKVVTQAKANALNNVESALKGITKRRNELLKKQSEGVVLDKQERKELKLLTVEQKKLQDSKQKLTAAVKNNVRSINSARGSYDGLVAETAELRASLRRLPNSFDKNNKAANRLKKQIFDNTKRLKEFDASMNMHHRNVGNYTSGLKGAAAQLGKFALGVGAAMVGMHAIISVFKNAANTIKNFEQGNANLASVLGKTREEITALTEDAKRLGSQTSFTASQVSELQTEFAKLGFTEREVISATEATLALAAATNTDLATAASVAGATVRGFGLDANETQRVVDVMAKSFSSSALDMSKFQTAMAQVAPVAKNAGLSIEETTSMLGLLTDRGIDASTAGTGLRGILLDLNKHGLTFEQALNKINNSTNKNATAFDLFGKRGATVASILAENQEQAAALTQTLTESGGAAQRMADEQLNTLEGKLKIMESAWEGLILQIESGDGAMGSFAKSAVDAMTVAINATQDFTAKFQELSETSATFKGVMNGISAVVKTSFIFWKTLFQLISAPFVEMIKLIDLAINKKFSEIPGAIKAAFSGTKDVAISAGQDIANTWVTAFEDTVAERIDKNAQFPFVKEQWNPFIDQAGAAGKDAGEAIIDGMIDGAKGKAEGLNKEVQAILKRMDDARIAAIEEGRIRETEKEMQRFEAEKERLKGNHRALELLEQEHQQIMQGITARFDAEDEERKIQQLEQDQIARAERDVLTAQTREEELRRLIEFEKQKHDLAVQNTELTNEQVALLEAQHAKKIADIEQQITDIKKKEAAERIAAAQREFEQLSAITMQAGEALGAFMGDQEKSFEDFQKEMMLLLISMVEKQVLASVASATAQSLAQPDSVATGGASGVARAAILAGLIKAAFTAFKVAVQSSEFEQGGYKDFKAKHGMFGGKPHSSGGTKGYFEDGTAVEVEKDEFWAVVNKKDAPRAQALSNINSIHGKSFFRDGGVKNKFAQGAAMPTFRVPQITGAGALPGANMDDIADRIVNGINDKRVINVATDTSRESDRVRNIQSRATFG